MIRRTHLILILLVSLFFLLNFAQSKAVTEPREILIIPYCHADFAYYHSRHWHEIRYNQAINDVLDIMREREEFRWYFDTYNEELLPFLKLSPGRVDEFLQRIKEGKIEIAGGTICNPEPERVGGETFIRNMILGRKIFKEMLPEVTPIVLTHQDCSPGSSQIPQLVLKGGFRYYWFSRPSAALSEKGIPSEFSWQGPDGSTVLCSRIGYGGLARANDIPSRFEQNWEDAVKNFTTEQIQPRLKSTNTSLVAISQGSDDTRPLRDISTDEYIKLIPFMGLWNQREKAPVRFALPVDYFHSVERERDKLPIVKGPIDPVGWSHAYGIMGNNSFLQKNKIVEIKLLEAERVSTFVTLCLGSEFLGKELEKLWVKALSRMGHAHGTLFTPGWEAEKERYEAVISAVDELIRENLREIASKVKSPEAQYSILVFNPLSWERKDIAKVHVAFPRKGEVFGIEITDTEGNSLPCQVIDAVKNSDGSLSDADVIFVAEVPSLGYKLFQLKPIKEKRASVAAPWHGKEFENQWYKIEVDEQGNPVKLELKEDGSLLDFRQLTFSGLVFFVTKGYMKYFPEIKLILPEYGKEAQVKASGEVLWTMRNNATLKHMNGFVDSITQEIRFYRHIPRIDVIITIDTLGKADGFYEYVFPSLPGGAMTAGIPFGAEPREIEKEPYIGFERKCKNTFYANEWLDLSGQDKGFTVLSSRTTYGGYRWYEQEKALSHVLLLLVDMEKGSPGFRKRHPLFSGKGRQRIEFALYPHRSNWTEAKSYRKSYDFLYPLLTRVVGPYSNNSTSSLPSRGSLLKIKPGNVVLSAVSLEGKGKSLILRVYETYGQETNAEITLPVRVEEAEEIDFCGRSIQRPSLRFENNKILSTIKPWEIVTLRVRGKSSPRIVR